MRLTLVSIGSGRRRGKRESEDVLTDEYLRRTGGYARTRGLWCEDEESFWRMVEGVAGRATAKVVLWDAGGRQLTSVSFAETLRGFRDLGAQEVISAVGGANGWSAESLGRADLSVSLGKMTLPHGLARVVIAEQIYRAMTILAGHPYHCGH